MRKKRYFMVFSRNQRIYTYRSENLNYFIKDAVNENLESYGFDPNEIISEDFDSLDFRKLFDFSKNEANALKKLVTFKELLLEQNIKLDKNSHYSFSEPDNKWALIFEQKYGSAIITGFTHVDEDSKVSFRIEEI